MTWDARYVLCRRRAVAGMLVAGVLAVVAAVVAGGCGQRTEDAGEASATADPRAAAVVERWGSPAGELPEVKLVLISPHNENIEYEYEQAFYWHYAQAHGKQVAVEWRDVGGGTSTILQYLRNVYGRSDTADIDVMWGGGEAAFENLAREGILEPMDIEEETLAAIPAVFGGIRMYDPELRWCGSAVSGFGFLYNKRLLKLRAVPPPERWQDLGKPAFFGLLALADPSQSGSAAAAYEMIVQSAPDWPSGWAQLLKVLSNAKRFYDSAGDAANAPLVGEAALATAIDFYGALRVARAPDQLVYVSPPGQTAFSPDPIGILKNPPHPTLASRFVNFVLSERGQALWALPTGIPEGPRRNALGRQPIRRDVYVKHRGNLLPWIVNPYEEGNEMVVDMAMKRIRDTVLKQLVRAAAVDNLDGLRTAREALIEAEGDARQRLDVRFGQLPDNVATREAMERVAADLKDATSAERIVSGWQAFFRRKYDTIAQDGG